MKPRLLGFRMWSAFVEHQNNYGAREMVLETDADTTIADKDWARVGPGLWRNRLEALTADQKVWGSIFTRAKAQWGYFLSPS
jgi:hypothetical protein